MVDFNTLQSPEHMAVVDWIYLAQQETEISFSKEHSEVSLYGKPLAGTLKDEATWEMQITTI